MISKKQEKLLNEQLEQKKEKLDKEYSKISVQFNKSKGDKLEEEFKKYTDGLTTREEFMKRQKNIQDINLVSIKQQINQKSKRLKNKEDDEQQKEIRLKKQKMIEKKKEQKKKQQQQLSFYDEDEDEEHDDENKEQNNDKNQNNTEKKEKLQEKNKDNDKETEHEQIKKKVQIGKNPFVNTEFLPDQERDRLINMEKEKLQLEYIQRKEKLENQIVELQYAYWDGFNVVKKLRVKQKTTIFDFIEMCRKNLLEEYPHLAKTKGINLIAVARDQLLPTKLSFYEIIESNLKNKLGQQIFNFKEKQEKDEKTNSEITLKYEEKTVIMIIEKKITEKQSENPIYNFLKQQ
ncbi:hypothetical protein PPERSA_07811 [Pseudocohnilembus persalinus]|uniref:XAP5 protein n=1 Tax=Pseudocohnilembus persalinus TaxID=266149 RepID=A0A0V0QBW5_PSEPJ|nr:hypothetical protein PPERSA_07811 [Pseudocohnilembus persalinus]|eukprot:KRW99734.1 hypothetical protein PPERSA_07811 [Pseudocohnilembus persalinus]